jgi:hypothetical protein
MRFTPTAFLGSSLGVELVATANGSTKKNNYFLNKQCY